MRTYGLEVAKAIVGKYCDDWVEINEKGVWPKYDDLDILQWIPVCELDGPDSPDPFTTPGLPIPFNVNELAAFMINGPGALVSSAYGNWQYGPDDEMLQSMGILATKAKEALRGAYAAYREAERIVGPLDMNTQNLADSLRAKLDTENNKANKRVKLYEKGISDLEYSTRRAKAREFIREISEKSAEASLLADKENKAWVNAMVRQLLQHQMAPTTDAATPAPVVQVKAKRRTWWDVSSPYIVEIMQAGQYAKAKDLYNALAAKAGSNSPFDKGDGINRYSLFIRELAKPLAMKTVQNNWQKLLDAAKKK